MQALEAENFKIRDATSYDDVTEQFDFFTERLSGPLAARMVSLAEIKSSEAVLDIGTGTGVVALQAAKKIGKGGKIRGIDLSEGMLTTANAKTDRLELGEKVEFSRMDAEKLAFDDQTFDVVVSLFALLHFPNPLTALHEIHRVMRRGGRLVVAVGSSPPLFSVSGLTHRLKLVPDVIRRLRGKQLVAPDFLDSLVKRHISASNDSEESHLASHSRDRTGNISELVRASGFKVLQTDWQGHLAKFETPEEFWEIQSTFSSIARKRLGAAPPEKVESLRQDFLKQCRKVQLSGGDMVYPFAAFYVVAQRLE